MSIPSTNPILFTVADGIATLTLDRPGVLNAIDVAMAEALSGALAQVMANPTVVVLLIKGNGRAFCGGGDISRFDGTTPHAEVAARTMELFHPAILRLANLPIPTVAAVHGAVAGAGIGLMLACDFVVAAPETRFTLAYPRIGATIDGGSSWFLPRLLGTRRAKELAMLSELITAASAKEMGLVTRVAPPAQLIDEALRFVQEIAAGPTRAFATIKSLIDNAHSQDLAGQLDAERDALVEQAGSVEFAEGIDAFRQKRPPNFSGS